MVASWAAQQAIYTTFCGLGFVVSYIPLYWHIKGEPEPNLAQVVDLTQAVISLECWHNPLDILGRDRLFDLFYQRHYLER